MWLRILNAASLDHCIGLSAGSFCNVTCLDGYFAQDTSSETACFTVFPWIFELKWPVFHCFSIASQEADMLFCSQGAWQLRGECLAQGLETTQTAVAQVTLRMSLRVDEEEPSTGLDWARKHEESLHRALANSMQVHPSLLRVELLPLLRRRLLQVMAFQLRVTWLLAPGTHLRPRV